MLIGRWRWFREVHVLLLREFDLKRLLADNTAKHIGYAQRLKEGLLCASMLEKQGEDLVVDMDLTYDIDPA